MVNSVVWLHIILGPFWCMCVALFGISLIPNSAKHIHQKGPNNICNHTTELTIPMDFN